MFDHTLNARSTGTGTGMDTPSDYGSDGYGSEQGQGHGTSSGRASGRVRDDYDNEPQVRSAFSDDQNSDSDNESISGDSEDSEDNIPLAQRIPGALQAQKSIRLQAKADRERKRKERQAQKQKQRTQKRTPQSRPEPVAIDDLRQKLLAVRAGPTSVSQQRARSPSSVSQQPASLQGGPSLCRPARLDAASPPVPYMYQDSNKAGRSVQEGAISSPSRQPTAVRPRTRSPHQSVPRPSSPSSRLPTSSITTQPVLRSATTAHRRIPSAANDSQLASAPRPPQERLSTQPGWAKAHETLANVQSETRQRRSHDTPEQRDAGIIRARTLSSGATAPPRVLHRTRPSPGPPLPPIPPMPQETRSQVQDVNAAQHRVFVGNMQRFNTVEIGPHTRARDVLDLVEAQGELRGEGAAQAGGWMLWELAQDFGMERPLRDYELPAEVCASWNNNMRLNAFLIKKTPLAPLLALKAMPSSSPTYSGQVQWESKRGKWNKRWMELREHSLWLSKRDNGKDSTFLCSLSNFDCYYVSRLHKAPKHFVFAVKSSDNLTLFENPADYLHVFSCDESEGQRWVERILLARSYVLHKERIVLFGGSASPSSSIAAASSSPNQNLSKGSNTSRAAPLLNVNAFQTSAGPPVTKNPFQSGSLLAKSTA